MERVTIPSKLDDKVLEEILLLFFNTKQEVDLELPIAIDYRGFGILPKLLLIIFTWVRQKGGSIIIPIKVDDNAALKDFADDYFGYVVLSTVWKSNAIVNQEGISLKRAFREFTTAFHNKIDFLSELPHDAILIPNFDHYSKSVGLSHWFYTADNEFFDLPSSLNNSVFRIFECLSINLKSKILTTGNEILEDIQSILWELMRNTQEHATRDYLNQVTLNPNTRAVYFRIQRSSKRNFIAGAKSHKGLIKYYNTVLEDGENFILEISVLDSGPGLVKRFLGSKWEDSFNIREDINTIKKCLIKGQTSVITSRGTNKGFGLDHVLKLLDKKRGFLKIRTGRASLYRDLSNDRYVETTDIDKIFLNDWTNSSSSQFVNMNYAEGTMITMVYPLNEIK